MVVLSAIGSFFKKIWEWIKQTAWIQPLLIVGIIFGVIFSIQPIVEGVKSGKAKAAKSISYYNDFQISLEVNHTDSEGNKVSEADLITNALEKVLKGNDSNAVENFKTTASNLRIDCGEKFFISYVSKTCEKCIQAKDGFALFQKSLGVDPSFMPKVEGEKFHMITIFADEETTETTEDETAFVKYLDRHEDFFEDVGSNAYQTGYFYYSEKILASDIEYLETADPVNFLTPTILLVELNKGTECVSEVMFGVEGADQNEKAKTLLDCWNHTGDFSVEED